MTIIVRRRWVSGELLDWEFFENWDETAPGNRSLAQHLHTLNANHSTEWQYKALDDT